MIYYVAFNCMHFAGLASYMNIAVTDPLQQLGLVAFDDVELFSSGMPAAEVFNSNSTAPTTEDNLLYIIAFSRNCTGKPLGDDWFLAWHFASNNEEVTVDVMNKTMCGVVHCQTQVNQCKYHTLVAV